MSVEPLASSVAAANVTRFMRIFVTRKDPDYEAVPDERMLPDFPKAEVVKNVSVGQGGQILSRGMPPSHVLVKVELSYIPDEPDPLEVYPPNLDDLDRNHTKEEKGIMALDPKVVAKYPALFMAADMFNADKQPGRGNKTGDKRERAPHKLAS